MVVRKTLKRVTRPPRRIAHGAVVVSTKVLDTALNGVHKALKTLTNGTRKVSKTALMISKSPKKHRSRKSKKRSRRSKKSKKRRG